MIVIEGDNPRLSCGRKLPQMGSHRSGTGDFAIGIVRVPLAIRADEENGVTEVVMAGHTIRISATPCRKASSS